MTEWNGFRPALIVVDMQEDFLPTEGALAVIDGRSIIPVIKRLLELPFVLKIATMDWHPRDHVSFASRHAGKRPFVDKVTVTNPENAAERYETELWPDHCVQHTWGSHMAAELDPLAFDRIVTKGTDARVEMYSALYAPLRSPRVGDSGLVAALRDACVTHVYVLGLAADYCVRSTAVDAQREGFATFLVEDGTRPVHAAEWDKRREEILGTGVRIVQSTGSEVQWVRDWTAV